VKCGNTGTCTVGCQGTSCTVDGKSAASASSPPGDLPGDFDAGL
jgi:hypothetical protein